MIRARDLALLLALVGCASTPPPVTVTERDLEAIQHSLETARPAPETVSDYRVSSIFVRDRAVQMRLVAITDGDGWQTTQRAACRRCGDDQQWSCLRMQSTTQASLPDGSTAVVHGLSGDLATRAIRFLLASPAAELRDVSRSALASITCLTSNSDPRRIYVEYGGVPHHAGIDYGVIVLEPQGKSFRIESVEPPPNWFEDSGARFPECGGGEIDVYPSC